MDPILKALGLTAALVGFPALLDARIIFNFDTAPVGLVTPFTQTVDGVTATFSDVCCPDRDPFVVAPSFFQTLTGNVLLDQFLPPDHTRRELTIDFDVYLTDFSVNFATPLELMVGNIVINVFLNGSFARTINGSGVVPPGGSFSEGVVGFTSILFNRVILSAYEADFAIDNVSINPIPEPASLVLVLLGAGAMWRAPPGPIVVAISRINGNRQNQVTASPARSAIRRSPRQRREK